MAKTKSKEIAGVLLIQAACEPWPKGVVKLGRLAAFYYIRVSCWALGFELLDAGLAIFIGPLMFGIAHIQRTADYADRRDAAAAEADR